MNSLQKQINYQFNNQELLKIALTHPSHLNEHPEIQESYQRLEFLGDAVLELLASDYLFKHFTKIREGRLTEIRSALVRTRSLADIAKKLNLGQFILLSKGEEANFGRDNENILADTLEALLAAIYLDSSLKEAKTFFNSFIKERLKKIVQHKLYLDPKTQLQEHLQAKYKKTPTYNVHESKTADSAKVFVVGVYLDKTCLATGEGKNKRQAEEQAAKKALGKITTL